MTGPELRRIMGRLKMSPVKLAWVLGETAVQVKRWRYSIEPIPDGIAHYIRGLAKVA